MALLASKTAQLGSLSSFRARPGACPERPGAPKGGRNRFFIDFTNSVYLFLLLSGIARSWSIKIERSMNKYPQGLSLRFVLPDGMFIGTQRRSKSAAPGSQASSIIGTRGPPQGLKPIHVLACRPNHPPIARRGEVVTTNKPVQQR